MNKLISNPSECGFCNIEENYRDDKCKHPENAGGDCFGLTFPTTCPLPDGYTLEQIKESSVEMADRIIPLIPKNSTDTIDKMIKRLKRRNRKDCYNYRPDLAFNYCRCIDINSSVCLGVNCGYFKPKKE